MLVADLVVADAAMEATGAIIFDGLGAAAVLDSHSAGVTKALR